jgi:hypothetical protein
MILGVDVGQAVVDFFLGVGEQVAPPPILDELPEDLPVEEALLQVHILLVAEQGLGDVVFS